MKPLVPALNAQFGVGAGGKRGLDLCFGRACVLRALSNGMENPTLFTWRPVLVRDSLDMHTEIISLACSGQIPYDSGVNLHCGA